MQIILLRGRSTAARSITLTPSLILMGLLALLVGLTAGAFAIACFVLPYTGNIAPSFMQSALNHSTDDAADQKNRFLKQNLATMATKLGEMEAQIMRLDALGERVQGLAGFKPEEFNFKNTPGNNHDSAPNPPPHTDSKNPPDLSMLELQKHLNQVSLDLEHRSDYMNVVETTLMNFKVKSKLLPTIQPVNVSYNESGFGWRTDPFTGRSAFHTGIDFPSPIGTPIVAAAGGVVISSEYHHDYGNMLEIDHGNNIITRYAHTSKILVNVGDIVRRGQHVADIGTTGRSTGAHLHFEVLVKGVQQDPHKFLSAGAEQARILASTLESSSVTTAAATAPRRF